MNNRNLKYLGLLVGGFVLFAFILPGMAQETKKPKGEPGLDPARKVPTVKDPKLKVVAHKGKGSTKVPTPTVPKTINPSRGGPPKLAVTEKLDLLKSGGGVTTVMAGRAANSYLRCTPRQPFDSNNKGWINFGTALMLESRSNGVYFDGSGEGLVQFILLAETGGRYLIEFGLQADNHSFTIWHDAQGTQKQTITDVTSDRPLAFVLDASPLNYYYIRVIGNPGKQWGFQYVEVTKLN